MKILFMTAHPFLPQMHGGSQKTTNAFCQKLIERGHQVEVLAGLLPDGWLGLFSRIKLKLNKLLLGRGVISDHVMGYKVWRTWFPWLAAMQVIQRTKPDVIVVLAMQPVKMALAARPSGVPMVILLQDVEFSQHGGEFAELGNIAAIANSNFTANTYREAFGINPTVIYPLIFSDTYKTTTTRQHVTFINPHKKKGLEIALEIAKRCADISFNFVQNWPLSETELRDLHSRLQQLPNVTLLPPQQDMRMLYGTTKVLLAPSLWREGYGRVATEAQFSGIPVLASTRGGLPEAVGDGGVLIDAEAPIDAWVNALQKLWDDAAYYNDKSTAALAHANRAELNLDYQVDTFEKTLMAARQGHTQR